MSTFYPLTVSDIRPTGSKAVCISFDLPNHLKESFAFIPGQYLTLKAQIGGREFRRAYSICSSPKSGVLSIGVKAVDKGVFSIYANQQLKAGDTLDVMPPEGRFTLRTHSDNQNNYIGFAAGSGITPILSILKAVLEDEPKSTFTLVYGNRSPQEAMFSSEISGLKQLYADRFTVASIFSKTREEDALFGRIDRANVNFLLKNKLPFDRYDKYFLCGPESMIETVKELLQEKGVKQEDILFELFTSSQQPEEFATQGDEVEVTIVLDDDTETFRMDKQSSILQAALDHGIEAPYSCQGGICSTCIARLTEGTAEMRKNQILTDAEVAEGFILTCQAHPTSNAIKVDYDDI